MNLLSSTKNLSLMQLNNISLIISDYIHRGKEFIKRSHLASHSPFRKLLDCSE